VTTAAPRLLSDRFGLEAAATVRAPGRVNLIGEHTDYSLLPVLPMAIGLGIDVAGAPASDDRVVAVSGEHPETVTLRTGSAIDVSAGWGTYVHGVLSVLGEAAFGRGARLAVSGDLPATGGLSSSSALTVGLLAVLDRLWALGLEPVDIVDLAIVAERISGVESGGMDQTVIALACEGSALRIDFEPRALRPVPIPDGISFVIAYSGTAAAKAGGARDHYNRSVVACRCAAALLAAALQVDAGAPPLLGRVAALASPADVEGLPEAATAGDVAGVAGIDPVRLVTLTRGSFDLDAPVAVRTAARHVLSEAARVDEAEAALVAGDVESLGRRFDESHASLREFGSITPGLDRVTEAARRTGAHGARVTGAGFGGWAVAVCDDAARQRVASAMVSATGGPACHVEPSGGAL